MSSRKKHIDELFKEGLKNLSLMVTDKDLDAIEGKASVFKDANINSEKGAFDNFELEITDLDWHATKAKLDKEKGLLEVDESLGAKFKGFEIEPEPQDWPTTYKKYKDAKRKRVAMWWWLSTGVIALVAGLSLLMLGNKSSDAIAVNTPRPQVLEQNANQAQSDRNLNTNSSSEGKQTDASSGSSTVSPNLNSNSSQNNKVKQSLNSSKKNSLSNLKIFERPNKASKPNLHGNLGNSDSRLKLDISKLKNTKIGILEDIRDLNPDMKAEVPEKHVAIDLKSDSTTEDESKKAAENDSKKKTDKKSGNDDEPELPPSRGWYLGASAQIAYASRVLAPSNNQMYNDIRRYGDKGFVQLGFGFEFGYRMAKEQLSVGMHVTQQNWSSQYNYSYMIYDSIPYIDINGNRKYFLVRGRDTSMNESVNVRISRIEVPFRYDRRFEINNKLDLSLGFGGILGINTSFKGNRILYPVNNQMYAYDKWSSFERRVSISPSISVGLQYKLNKHYIIASDMFGSIYAMSRFKQGFGAKDFPYNIGMNIKLLYLFK